MSELINNSDDRKAKLTLKLHSVEKENEVREELMKTLNQIPYDEVVEVEQELMCEGLPESEVLRLYPFIPGFLSRINNLLPDIL